VLGRDLFLPVGVGDLSLFEAVLSEICVGPYGGAVAVQFGPVALCFCQIRVIMRLKAQCVLRSMPEYHSSSQQHCGNPLHDGP
jgi:hypothetical protein